MISLNPSEQKLLRTHQVLHGWTLNWKWGWWVLARPLYPAAPRALLPRPQEKKTVLRPQVHQVHRSTVGERRAPHSSSCASRPECKGSRKISSSTNGQVIKTLLPPPPRALWPSELFLVLKKFKKRFFFLNGPAISGGPFFAASTRLSKWNFKHALKDFSTNKCRDGKKVQYKLITLNQEIVALKPGLPGSRINWPEPILKETG